MAAAETDSDTAIETVLAQLRLEEKAALTIGSDIWHTGRVDRQGIEPIMVSDGPHGLRAQFEVGDHVGLGGSVPATCFPTASALASSWNPDLAHRVGAAIGREARRWGVAVVLGPGINMKRTPLCGRNFEYFSEDPHLAGVLGSALTRGIQSLGVGTSVKHFAANNQETDRMRVSAEVDERTLREIYLPAFERVITEAAPWTVMCAYNKINGTYASEHHWLLTEVLRDEWGFDGLVMSDWGAVHDRVAALRAGLDLEMPPVIGHSDAAVVRAVRDGELDEAIVDETVRRLLRLVERTRPARQDPVDFDEDDHHRLARTAAAESAVLLKNEGDLLPLDPAAGQRILVVGEFARTPRFQGAGSSQVNPTRIDVPLDELTALAGPDTVIDFAPGFSLTDPDADDQLRADAVQAAANADVVLAFLGLPAAAESEGYDRDEIELPANQRELLQDVAAVNPRVAVVLAGGSVVTTADWQHRAGAILQCWLSGQAAGGAVADLIFGVANPSGKLAETIPVRLADHPSSLNFPGEDGVVRYGEGVFIGYRAFDRTETEVSFPFGHGLSYTRFAISDLAVSVDGSVADDDLDVTVTATVTNTGDRVGADVVQVYVGDPESSVARPVRELRDFAKVELEPGASTAVEFHLGSRAFAFWSTRLHRWAVEAGDFTVAVGSSSRDLTDTARITLDAPSITGPITAMSTLDEALTDEHARALMDSDPRISAALQRIDADLLALIGSMPLHSAASFGMLGFGLAELDTFLSDLERRRTEQSA